MPVLALAKHFLQRCPALCAHFKLVLVCSHSQSANIVFHLVDLTIHSKVYLPVIFLVMLSYLKILQEEKNKTNLQLFAFLHSEICESFPPSFVST